MIKYERLTPTDDGYFIISNNAIGALSLVSGEELIMFQLYNHSAQESLKKFLYQMGYNQNQIDEKINLFENKLNNDGWKRTSMPENWALKLQLVYLNLTSNCNYRCVYCYQGAEKKINYNQHAFIKLKDLEIILGKIKKINQDCEIVITGGEPFLHSDIFEILQFVEQQDFKYAILTNASLINEKCALKLSELKNLVTIQVSIDGITESVHNLTRGDTFYLTMAGIKKIIKYKIPFSVAPTVHNGNSSEIYELARLAFMNNGGFSPNMLMKFPHCPALGFEVNTDNLLKVLIEVEERTVKDFGEKLAREKFQQSKIPIPNNKNQFICGTGYSLVNIDWNGDVYPCHLLMDERLKIGNLITDEFNEIFQKARDLGIRTMSYEIEKCKDCHFMTTCRGGCKAAAFYAYGNIKREDVLCEALYKIQLNNLLRNR